MKVPKTQSKTKHIIHGRETITGLRRLSISANAFT